jgi:hypothetical protein
VTPPVAVRAPDAVFGVPGGPEVTLAGPLKAGDEATSVCVAATLRIVGVPAEPQPASPAARSEPSATRSR